MLICSYLPGGEISFVNRAYCDYFGKTLEELVGSNFLSLIPQADQKTIRDNISQRAASGDFACGSGGGIKSGSGTLVLINSTVTENYAASERGRGGGIHVGCNCTAEFANSTISGNRAVGEGGGIDAHGTLQLTNCTVSDNHAGSEGGGIYVRGRLDYVNTIVANNTGKSGNCAVAVPLSHLRRAVCGARERGVWSRSDRGG